MSACPVLYDWISAVFASLMRSKPKCNAEMVKAVDLALERP